MKKALKVFHVAAGCIISPSFAHLFNLVPTEAPLCELRPHSPFSKFLYACDSCDWENTDSGGLGFEAGLDISRSLGARRVCSSFPPYWSVPRAIENSIQ